MPGRARIDITNYRYPIIFLILPFLTFCSLFFYGCADSSGKFIFTLLLSLYILTVIQFLIKKKSFFLTGYLKLFILFSVFFIIYLFVNSLNVSSVHHDSLEALPYYIILLVGFFFLIEIEIDRNYICTIIFLLGIFEVIIAIFKSAFLNGGFTGTFYSPNIFADFLILSFFSGIAILNYYKRGLKIAIFLSLFIFVIMILLTGSRGGSATLIVAAILFSLRWKRFLLSFIILLFAVTIVFTVNNPLKEKVFSGVKKDPFLWERTNIWKSSLKVIKENPIFGVGVGNYKYDVLRHRYPSKHYFAKYSRRPAHPHNEYLYLISEIGLFGSLLLIIMIILLLFYYKPGYELYGIIGILVHSFVNDSLAIPGILFPFLLLFASGIKIKSILKKEISIKRSFYIYSLAFFFLLISFDMLFKIEEIFIASKRYGKFIDNATLSYQLPYNQFVTYGLIYNRTRANNLQKLYIDYLDRSLKRNPYSSTARQKSAVILSQYARSDEFIETLNQEIEMLLYYDPYNVFNYETVGDIYSKLGKKELAMKYYEDAIALEPNFAVAIYKLGKLRNSRRLINKAKEIYREYFFRFSQTIDGKPLNRYEYNILNYKTVGGKL